MSGVDLMTTPPWPSLYNIALEITPVQYDVPIQSDGHYLTHPSGRPRLLRSNLT